MKKFSVLALSVVLAMSIGCSKKEDAAPSSEPASAQPTAPADQAPPAGEAAAGGPAAAGGAKTVVSPPDGMPQACTDAFNAMKKLEGCGSMDEATRASMIEAWNAAVSGSLVHYTSTTAENQATIERSCASMTRVLPDLMKGC